MHASRLGAIGAIWATIGITLFLGYAVWRLGSVTLEAWAMPWSLLAWVVLIINIVFMAYCEGYRGFQQAFSPRVAARIKHLYQNPKPLLVALAPAYAMGFFHATKRRMITAWVLTLSIIALVLLFRLLPQPWRGILDAGVVVGLSWGIVSTLLCIWRAFSDPAFDHPADLPQAVTSQ